MYAKQMDLWRLSWVSGTGCHAVLDTASTVTGCRIKYGMTANSFLNKIMIGEKHGYAQRLGKNKKHF